MTGTIHESCTPALRSRRRLKKLVCQKRLTAYQVQQIRNGKDNALVLGNYVILGTLGQGGMGLVFKAQQRRMERLVALKVLSPKVVQTPESLLRFQREVKAAARLTHPNIVMAYDADEASGTHFLVMEYVDGTDLASLVTQRGPLPLDRTLDFILQAARGLEYAHQHGVIPHLLLLACGVWLLGLARWRRNQRRLAWSFSTLLVLLALPILLSVLAAVGH